MLEGQRPEDELLAALAEKRKAEANVFRLPVQGEKIPDPTGDILAELALEKENKERLAALKSDGEIILRRAKARVSITLSCFTPQGKPAVRLYFRPFQT